MSKEIKYEAIKAIDINSAMKASGKATTAERAVKVQGATVWNQTVCLVMDLCETEGVSGDITKEGIESLRDDIKDIVCKHIEASVEIPEEGYNRSGKKFKVRNDKDNTVKWSSWDQTRRIMSYLGDIAKILRYGKESALYPEDLTVGARGDVLALCKEDQTPLDHIIRLAKDLQGFAEVIEPSESVKAQDAVQGVVVNNLDPQDEALGYISKLNSVIGGLDSNQKEAVASALITLAQKLK